jgi:hypothetical protein
MRGRKNIWGGIFAVIVVFTATLAADLTLNQALNAAFLYANLGLNHLSAEVLFIAVLTLPVIALISGIQFLRYFVKLRKHRKSVIGV